ncbi:preprotein translocase subunit SecG [bacterium]|nr:preprotein translocase subunit SecG [bacterium]
MTSPILFGFLQFILGPLIFMTSVFLILVVLVQRGRGGGLTGALGGAGGQSAFGAKAGDVFTKITIVVAIFWILLCILATMTLQDKGDSKVQGEGGTSAPASSTLPANPAPGGGPAMTIPPVKEGEKPAETAAPSENKPSADLEPPANTESKPTPPAEEAPKTESKPAE